MASPIPSSSSTTTSSSSSIQNNPRVQSTKVARLSRDIMSVTSAMSLLALVSVILQMIVGFFYSAGIIASIVIPLCGYCGAVNRSRSCMWTFILCNAFFIIFFIASLIVGLTSGGGRGGGNSFLFEIRNICLGATGSNAGTCAIFWISMAFALAMLFLQCIGFVQGLKLVTHPAFKVESPVFQRPAIVVATVPMSPEGQFCPPPPPPPHFPPGTYVYEVHHQYPQYHYPPPPPPPPPAPQPGNFYPSTTTGSRPKHADAPLPLYSVPPQHDPRSPRYTYAATPPNRRHTENVVAGGAPSASSSSPAAAAAATTTTSTTTSNTSTPTNHSSNPN